VIEHEQPDHIYCQLLRTAWAIDGLSVNATIDYQDAFAAAMRRRGVQHNSVLRRAFEFEADRIGTAEARAFEAFARRVVISEQDRDCLEVPDPLGVEVLPNGVDTSHFARRDPSTPTDVDVAFVGNMGYPPNVRAAHMLVDEVMPLVWARRPSARVLLAGARPTRSVRALAGPKVEVSGWVDDIRDAYRRSRLMAAPLFIGAGQQNKVLEAMAMGVPCVTTELVNNAIGADPHRQILLAATASEFASRIVDVLDSAATYRNISDAAWEFVDTEFSWSAVGDRLSAIVESV
jgi:glycosyltransferase involved in cell wall biosynthesis